MTCSQGVKRGEIYNRFRYLGKLVMRNVEKCHLVELKHSVRKIGQIFISKIKLIVMVKLSKQILPRVKLSASSWHLHLNSFHLFSFLFLFCSQSQSEILFKLNCICVSHCWFDTFERVSLNLDSDEIIKQS